MARATGKTRRRNQPNNQDDEQQQAEPPNNASKIAKQAKSDDALESIATSAYALFNQAQNSLTGHRKLVNNLHRLLLSSAKIRLQEGSDDSGDKTIKLAGEKMFTEACYAVLDQLLITRKGIIEAERVIKFLGSFCAFSTEHGYSSFLLATQKSSLSPVDSYTGGETLSFSPSDPEKGSSAQTPTTRLLFHLIKYLSRGFEAKNKVVRFRCCQILAYVVNSLEEIDDRLFGELRDRLLVRVHDKEKDVRQQAGIALMNFRPVDEDEEVDAEEENVNDALIDLMIRDPCSEVRRTVLHKLCEAPTAATLTAILTRLRDIDPSIRRMVYRDLFLATMSKPEPTLPHDPSQCFTLDQRHLILKGLQDREEAVRKEAVNLINCWIRMGYGGSIEKFLSSFGLIELVSGEDEEDDMLKISNIERAVKAWVGSGGLSNSFDADTKEVEVEDGCFCSERWWDNLKPEGAFLLRIVAEHYKSLQDEVRLDAVMPVVTALAFRIEHNFRELIDLLNRIESTPADPMEDEEAVEQVQLATRKTFIIRELLTVAMIADYGDEIGRRKMFSLLRELVSNPLLPHALIPGCLEVLLKLSTGERDFMRVIVELVQELRSNLEPEPNFTSPNSAAQNGGSNHDDDQSEEDEGEGEASFRKGRNGRIQVTSFSLNPANSSLDLRCLATVKALLERVSGSIKDNTSMFGIVHELIVPAVRCKEGPIRERGLVCLGLCSLLDKQIALDSFGVFVHQVQAAEMGLRVKVLKIVFDLLLQHGIGFLAEKGHGPERVTEFLLYSLDQESKNVQATAAIGISKLMLSGIITSSEVLQMLVLVYFSPETCDNQKLRQCLSYFLPVYCYCSSVNQRRMQSMILPALDVLSGVYDDQEDKSEMLSPSQIALQLVDWTDPSRVVVLPGCKIDWEIHLDEAIDIVKNLFRVRDRDERRMFCQMLTKLTLPENLEAEVKLRALSFLITELRERRPLSDSTSQNILSKFHAGLTKKFHEQLTDMSEEALGKVEGMAEYVEYVEQFGEDNAGDDDDDASEDGEVPSDPGGSSDDFTAKIQPKRTPVRRSIKSIASRLNHLSDEDNVQDSAPRRSSRPRTSRQSACNSTTKQELESLIGSSTGQESSDSG